jgi:hypothetical protein
MVSVGLKPAVNLFDCQTHVRIKYSCRVFAVFYPDEAEYGVGRYGLQSVKGFSHCKLVESAS